MSEKKKPKFLYFKVTFNSENTLVVRMLNKDFKAGGKPSDFSYSIYYHRDDNRYSIEQFCYDIRQFNGYGKITKSEWDRMKRKALKRLEEEL